MNRVHSLWLICLGFMVFGLGGAIVKADTITFSATGTGISTPTSDPTKPIFSFLATGTYNMPFGTMAYSAPGEVNFTITNPDGSSPNKGTFTFSLPNGDKFSGTFVGNIFPPNAQGLTTSSLSYTITSGTGIFAGATGTGASVINFNVVTGIANDTLTMTISAPGLTTPIPEPATLLLLGTGMAGLAYRFRRRGPSR